VPEFAGITFALPHLVSGSGPLATIAPPLDEAERTSLERSASVLRDAIGSLHLAGRWIGGQGPCEAFGGPSSPEFWLGSCFLRSPGGTKTGPPLASRRW